MSKEKVSVKYSADGGFELRVGDRVIPNSTILEPANIQIRANSRPIIQISLMVDNLEVDDLELTTKVRGLPAPNKTRTYKKG